MGLLNVMTGETGLPWKAGFYRLLGMTLTLRVTAHVDNLTKHLGGRHRSRLPWVWPPRIPRGGNPRLWPPALRTEGDVVAHLRQTHDAIKLQRPVFGTHNTFNHLSVWGISLRGLLIGYRCVTKIDAITAEGYQTTASSPDGVSERDNALGALDALRPPYDVFEPRRQSRPDKAAKISAILRYQN